MGMGMGVGVGMGMTVGQKGCRGPWGGFVMALLQGRKQIREPSVATSLCGARGASPPSLAITEVAERRERGVRQRLVMQPPSQGLGAARVCRTALPGRAPPCSSDTAGF